MAFIDDDELERLKKEMSITGNDTIDGYCLGYEAGRETMRQRVSAAESEKWEYLRGRNDAEKRAAELEAENAALKDKVRKLKRRLKGDK